MTDNTTTKPPLTRFELQTAEFDAVAELSNQYRWLCATPIVDDDYPAVRHRYEGALTTFLRACAANGRSYPA